MIRHPIAVLWAPTIVAIAMPLIALALLWLRRGEGPDDSDDGGGGGGGGRGPSAPRRPPPAGPVWWPEFERQFADHVARLAERRRSTTPRR